jgi:probable rRNA maturation factor
MGAPTRTSADPAAARAPRKGRAGPGSVQKVPIHSARPHPLLAREALQFSLQLADATHWDVLPRHRVARWLRAALAAPAQIAVRIVGAAEGRALNRDFRGKDAATNVLTFAYEREPTVVADLVLCAPVVEREAREQGLTLESHYAHLVVHGALHAQGFDHEADADAAAMEARESAIVVALGFADPYAR